MKRSRPAALLLMSATPLLLTACDDDSTREGVYTSVETCTAQTHDAATCQQAFDKASVALKGGDLKTVGPVTTQAPATLESLAELGQHPAIRKALLDTSVGGTTPLLWSHEGKLWVAKVTSKKLDTPLGFEQRHALVQKLQETGAEKRLTAELQYLENRGRMRPGLSSLWGRWDGIWMNPAAGKASAREEE